MNTIVKGINIIPPVDRKDGLIPKTVGNVHSIVSINHIDYYYFIDCENTITKILIDYKNNKSKLVYRITRK